MVHFLNRSHAESTSSWGLLSLMDFLREPQISKTPASFGTKRNPRGLSRTSASSFADSVSLGGVFAPPKKGAISGEWLLRLEAVFFWGWFPPPSLWRYCTNNSSQPETGRLGQKWHLSGTSRRRVTIPSSRPMKISNSAGYIVWSVISLSS